jgi:hypothetical protein
MFAIARPPVEPEDDEAAASLMKAAGASATPGLGTWTGRATRGATRVPFGPWGVEERFMNVMIDSGVRGRQRAAPLLLGGDRDPLAASRWETLMAGEVLAFLHRHNRATLITFGAISLLGLLAL